MAALLLSRYAECIFWLARYMERAENLARILDVNETFARDGQGATHWRPILQLNADQERFFQSYPAATAENVLNFYILDGQNPTSILFAVRAARENARQLRPLISTEMWAQLNVFYNRLLALGPADISLPNLQRQCAFIKEACQAHAGITEGTFFRDQGWYFYQLGKYLERADQTTRLLDIKYHTLLPQSGGVGSPIDLSQWNALLRSAAGYHAFRRINPRGMTPATVAGFLLFNRSFPRSVALCTHEIQQVLSGLTSKYRLRRGNLVLEKVDELQDLLASQSIETVINHGLHEYLDGLQVCFGTLSDGISRAFFGFDQPVAVTA
ncbi:alpha-E domain-containing protein [Aerophototrophica crusticola]|uniref:Alpha-E domain-containing protein n=1 Tax=Aerophototrophica crusticola TaxID=1709002 RepID=A0A858R5P2_9PROT|nr:alpha-E domain-containing protein [Rhodospirillaceae bacterium B3]